MKFKDLLIMLIASLLAGMLCIPECLAVQFSPSGLRLQRKVKSIREIRDQNVVRQTTDYSCGAAGLSTILKYSLNDPIGEKEIILEMLRITSIDKVKQRKGFSLLDLKRFAQSRGYKVTAYQMDIDFLRDINTPVLVPIKFKNFRHFVIVKSVIGNRVFVADPAMGNMVMKVGWFKRIWQDGIGLIVESSRARNPFKPYIPSALIVKKEDAVVVNDTNIKRYLEAGNARTNVFPAEF